MNKTIILSLALLMQSVICLAQSTVWDEITDWSQYVEETELGDVVEYAPYDVDGDKIPEVFVKDVDGFVAFLTCGTNKEVTCIQSTMYTTSFYLVRGKPYVVVQGGCGTSCHTDEFMKIEGSKVSMHCQRVITYDPNDNESSECYMFKDGDSKEISNTLYEKLFPSNVELIQMEELTWKQAPIDPDVETAEFHVQKGDTIILKDSKGYLYQIMSDRSLGVAPGGAYSGDIVIPDRVSFNGKTYNVTTVRRGAMWKKPGASNIGVITSITLPASVTLVGADAFRGNASLKSVKYGNDTRIEVRSFWGCPKLALSKMEPAYAYSELYYSDDENPLSAEEVKEKFAAYYMPTEEKDESHKKYTWAFFKYNHAGIYLNGWMNFDKENGDAIACWCGRLKHVKGAMYRIRNRENIESMFKGYMDHDVSVMLADNNYVATHEFPMFSRHYGDEEAKQAPQGFVQSMEKKYGRKVKYCYQVGKLLYSTNEMLVITEFKITNHEAMYVLSWLKDNKEVCSYERRLKLEPDMPEEYSVWNVDDDGEYGIPLLSTIARDENGNIELFIEHGAPESITFYHLVQKGNKLELVAEDSIYVWIDSPE